MSPLKMSYMWELTYSPIPIAIALSVVRLEQCGILT